MPRRSTTIFHRSGLSWFPVPQDLFRRRSKSSPAPIEALSAGALRLYLFLLSRAGSEQEPIVRVTNADIAKKAKVTKNNVKNAREELERHSLVSVLADGAFEILSPGSGNKLPSSLPKVKASRYTYEQVQAVFTHYLAHERLDDNANGMLFICPFHNIGVNSPSKRKKHLLSVKKSETGLWQCTDPKCRRNGKRRTELQTNTWDEPVGEVVVGGGGDLLDFVAAIDSSSPTVIRLGGPEQWELSKESCHRFKPGKPLDDSRF